MTATGRSEQFQQGIAMIGRMFPGQETRGQVVAESVRRDWGMYTVETVMGEVWSRPGLGLRERSEITIAALAALGRQDELRLHLRGALRNGLTRHEVSEVIMHLRAYAGAPASLTGLRIVQEVFDADPDLGEQGDAGALDPDLPADRFERGRAIARRLFPRGALRGLPVPEEIAAGWARYAVATTFGDVWARPGLSLVMRSRVTVAVLTVLHRPEELRLHLAAARHIGISREEICEAMMHLSIYGGFPVAVEGLRAAKEVFDQEAQP